MLLENRPRGCYFGNPCRILGKTTVLLSCLGPISRHTFLPRHGARIMPSRRQFLLSTAAAGMGYWVAGGVEAKESTSANGRIAFASIGVAGKGASDSEDAGRAGDMVAICDVDDHTLNNAGDRRFPKAK